ncbi:MAG: hypothetical protein D5R97_02790 [Candidatus Syntrophonatronum acetioxidans]|uniref:Sporulation protein YtxC n=1 Tax=Candidatus Syntrophonatronum acetioxidans TaxID=1795816 RepID=A0A424YGU0_9FIRM|nr:MAG: hypothetical protein D5R97_02790 [Candidatus Syntrophonatronum acetioxidans]
MIMTGKGIVIETQEYVCEFEEKFQSDILKLKKKDVVIKYIAKERGQVKTWLCLMERNSQAGEDLSLLLRYYLSGILSDFIVAYAREIILEKLLSRDYSYFNKTERELILSLTLHKLNQEERKRNYFYDKNYLANRFKGYFKNNDFVNIEGFIIFRLQKMQSDLKYHVEATIDEYLEEQEYQEIIRLLKDFVAPEEAEIKSKKIHLTLDQEGEYVLRDEGLKPLQIDFAEGSCLSLYNSNLQKVDLIITVLAHYSPEKIIIHRNFSKIYPKAVEAILNIFGDRGVLCKKCSLCQKYQLSQKLLD